MPDIVLGSREAGANKQTRSCPHGIHSLVEMHNEQVKNQLTSKIMKNNKIKFSDIIENDEW